MQKIFTYALVILTGMVMATFAAYYILNQFVYPMKTADMERSVPTNTDSMSETGE